jgi:hypothetical protein
MIVKTDADPKFGCCNSEVLSTADAHTGLNGQLGVIRLLVSYNPAMFIVAKRKFSSKTDAGRFERADIHEAPDICPRRRDICGWGKD